MMSTISKKTREKSYETLDNRQKYIARITKTLYYGTLPKTDRLSLPVTELAAELFSETQCGRSLERLHFNDAAKISRKACISPCSLILAMLYLDRLKKRNPQYLEQIPPSNLFLVSLMVSSKFLFDDGESDEVFIDEWANSGGLTIRELVLLEIDFLKAMEWELYIDELSFWKKLNEVERTLAKKQGTDRGFFTYTELENLVSTIELYNLIQCLVAVSALLVATYTVCLFTMVGSFYLASQIPGNALHYTEIGSETNNTSFVINEDLHLKRDHFEIKTDIAPKNILKNMHAVEVFKTSLILASIKSSNESYSNDTSTFKNDTEYMKQPEIMTWDWWNIPSMNWLSKTSEVLEMCNLAEYVHFGYFANFLEICASNSNQLALADHINKATKTRIQDQLESSWHKEWTDSIKKNRIFNIPYFHIIKS